MADSKDSAFIMRETDILYGCLFTVFRKICYNDV